MAYNIVATGATSNLFKIEAVNTAVNGVVHKILDTNVTLANAPTVLPYDATLTPEQIASGVIKHADASNSGLITNGKFDTDTSGWSGKIANASIVGGELKVQPLANASSTPIIITQFIPTIIGKSYKLEYSCRAEGSGLVGARVQLGSTAVATNINASNTTNIRKEGSFTAIATSTLVEIVVYGTTSSIFVIDNIAVFPADAISRSDLVFLESWHEDVSEKDFVYPLGNVQYLGGATDGLSTPTNGAFSGFGTYSLFGNWQTSSALIGNGYVWSGLTDAQKKAFVSNPENNMYLDGATYVQVRYRVRVVQGWGDSWTSVSSRATNTAGYGATTSISVASFGAYTLGGTVNPKGKLSVLTNEIGDYYQGWFNDLGNQNSIYNSSGLVYIGSFCGVSASGAPDTTKAYEGKCYALPIALVHR